MTATKRAGTGESFQQFPIQTNDYILADWGYLTVAGIQHVKTFGSYVTLRVNTGALHFETKPDQPFDLWTSV